jgi:hypothetical protein
MDFTRTTTPPDTTASVTVEFAGLMILRPGAENTCSIGVHRWSYLHTFQVMLVVDKPDRPPSVVRLLTGPLSDPVTIGIAGEPEASNNFKAYAATEGNLERSDENATNYPLDYRWVLNLKERHYNADWKEAGVKPQVTLKTGTLYTLNLTPRDLYPKYVRYDPPTTDDLHYFAGDLAAALTLPTGKKVRLAWTELGKPQGLDLPRSEDPPNTSYVISLINEPPMSYPPEHDELAIYYEVVTVGGAPVPLKDRWILDHASNISTDRIPCMPTSMEPS